ncbi:hypothetical protein BD410DRAFT_444495 [Rickenella mellea]|uniref:Uncharacterized protein n=1 Tax=Rickenella mellea TaxID=50990 RepID=A0A4Y7PV71_9AGAM|nr:hypothetical protein BD410DRAFT_444495 [Rickenella mellea]
MSSDAEAGVFVGGGEWVTDCVMGVDEEHDRQQQHAEEMEVPSRVWIGGRMRRGECVFRLLLLLLFRLLHLAPLPYARPPPPALHGQHHCHPLDLSHQGLISHFFSDAMALTLLLLVSYLIISFLCCSFTYYSVRSPYFHCSSPYAKNRCNNEKFSFCL